MNRSKCARCSWYVWRPLSNDEIQWLKKHPGYIIDTRFCTLGGCDGSLFLNSNHEVIE